MGQDSLTPSTSLISTAAKSFVEPYLSNGKLRLHNLSIATLSYSLQIILYSRNDRNPKIAWLRDSIRGCCRGAVRFRNPPKRKRPKR